MKKHSTTPKEFRKPRPDFPLFPHKGKRLWAKKVRGETKYFGRCEEDPAGKEALQKWLNEKEDLLAGRDPRSKNGGIEVFELCNAFLNAKLDALKAGEITAVTFQDYRGTTDRIVEAFGKRRIVGDLNVSDFAALRRSMTKTLGPVALGNAVQRVRGVFKFAFDNRMIPAPMAFGSEFKPPSKKVKRKHRNERAPRLFDADELKALIGGAGLTMKAMILLGVNAALGNSDIAHLPIKALDLAGGWLNFPRPKTGIQRRVPLWPETVEALRKVLSNRPHVKDPADAGIVFITKYGHRWDKLGRFTGEIVPSGQKPAGGEKKGKKKKTAKTIASNKALSKEFKKVAAAAGIDRTFYDLRHTFRTVAGGAKDVEASRAIMGHVNEHVESDYIEMIDDGRLKAVTDHVRAWLYASGEKENDRPAVKKTTKAKKHRTNKPAPSKRQASVEAEPSRFRIVG